MPESPVATALGVVASALFVVSHVPQVVALWRGTHVPSPSMFVLQFVSGTIWIAYGLLESATTILAFGSLTTVFRVLILGMLICRRASPSDGHSSP
jgi:uncharacterized protein with PQ loop repeat